MPAAGKVEDDEPDVSETAIAALALSIVWIFGLGSIAALVLARMSLREINASDGQIGGRSLVYAAIAGAFVGLIGTGLIIAIGVNPPG